MTLLSESSVGGGALELEDLAGVVGAVGLLATLGDEFVEGGGDEQEHEHEHGGAYEALENGRTAGEPGGAKRNAGRALRECLSEKAREFFQDANKVSSEVEPGMMKRERQME